MKRIGVLLILCLSILLPLVSGCSSIPIRNGELQMNANTSATLDDIGVARINNRF